MYSSPSPLPSLNTTHPATATTPTMLLSRFVCSLPKGAGVARIGAGGHRLIGVGKYSVRPYSKKVIPLSFMLFTSPSHLPHILSYYFMQLTLALPSLTKSTLSHYCFPRCTILPLTPLLHHIPSQLSILLTNSHTIIEFCTHYSHIYRAAMQRMTSSPLRACETPKRRKHSPPPLPLPLPPPQPTAPVPRPIQPLCTLRRSWQG